MSKDIHGTLDELREQQTLLQTQLQIVENDLKSSQGRVKELETELTALIISSENTNARLADYSTKLTVSDSKLRFWRRTAVIGWGILLCLIAAFVMKKLGFLAKYGVTAVMPYFAYARQDRKDRSRVPISAKLVANLLAASGVNRVVTMDLHAPQIQGFFDIPLDHLLAAPVLVRHIRERHPSDIVVVAPDPGSLKMAYSYSKRLGGGIALVAKQRRSATQVEALDLVGDVSGRHCIIVDDMTATAGTLCAAAHILVARGAASVCAAVSHCPITPIGIERLKTSPIEELATTDSIPPPDFPEGTPVSVMSVAPLFGEAIKRIHGDESVSNLFEIHEGE